MIIAIDGPAAAGKGTLARKLADHLGYAYLDTGSLYRLTAYAVLQKGGNPKDPDTACEAARKLNPESVPDHLLRNPQIAEAASYVAALPEVRREILDFQRSFARKSPGVILDGRDIGTVVCPDADIKLYVTASVKARAKRRFLELSEKGLNPPDIAEVEADITERDRRDMTRKTAPLKKAEDAHLLDTSNLDIEGAFTAALEIITSADH